MWRWNSGCYNTKSWRRTHAYRPLNTIVQETVKGNLVMTWPSVYLWFLHLQWNSMVHITHHPLWLLCAQWMTIIGYDHSHRFNERALSFTFSWSAINRKNKSQIQIFICHMHNHTTCSEMLVTVQCPTIKLQEKCTKKKQK